MIPVEDDLVGVIDDDGPVRHGVGRLANLPQQQAIVLFITGSPVSLIGETRKQLLPDSVTETDRIEIACLQGLVE